MKKQLFFLSLFLMVIISTLPAQTTGGNKPKTNAYPASKPAKEFKTKYHTCGSGVVIPLGAFANRDYSQALSGAGGTTPGMMIEYSTLRLFNKEPDRPYYFGLQTLSTAYWLPIKFEPSSNDVYSLLGIPNEYRAFPAGEIKLGPAMAFPIGEKTLLDFNANIGATVTVPLHLGYWMADEEISGSYRINSLHFMNVTSPVAFSLVGGIGGHARYGKFVFGLDLNFGKMKFDVLRETNAFTYAISNDNLVNVENTSTTTKEALRITSLRFKISMGW